MGKFLKTKLTSCIGITAIFLLSSLVFMGCASMDGYLGFWGRQKALKKQFHQEPTADLLRQLEPEGCFMLVGRVATKVDYHKPLLVVAVTDTLQKREIVASKIIPVGLIYYSVYLPEGHYDLYFFADLDDNGFFEKHEMISQVRGESILINKSRAKDGFSVTGPVFSLDTRNPTTTDLPVKARVRGGGRGVRESLEDEFFDPKYGLMGLYHPKSFMAHTQRYVFALEEFDPDKTVVFFVHGVQGTPRDFSYLVAGLDRDRYQPWFYFYPSGMPLQKLGSLLVTILKSANDSGYYPLKSVIVVAHSMGGLVALSGLNQLCPDGVPSYLKGYVSLNTPYRGVTSAKIAVENAPAVLPSWRDMALGSPFFEKLYKDTPSLNIPFYLFFGYKTGDSSDGTVALHSQLEPAVYFSALKSYGFNATHAGILNDEAAREKLNEVLGSIDGSEK